jgi:hypothetical protein
MKHTCQQSPKLRRRVSWKGWQPVAYGLQRGVPHHLCPMLWQGLVTLPLQAEQGYQWTTDLGANNTTVASPCTNNPIPPTQHKFSQYLTMQCHSAFFIKVTGWRCIRTKLWTYIILSTCSCSSPQICQGGRKKRSVLSSDLENRGRALQEVRLSDAKAANELSTVSVSFSMPGSGNN